MTPVLVTAEPDFSIPCVYPKTQRATFLQGVHVIHKQTTAPKERIILGEWHEHGAGVKLPDEPWTWKMLDDAYERLIYQIRQHHINDLGRVELAFKERWGVWPTYLHLQLAGWMVEPIFDGYSMKVKSAVIALDDPLTEAQKRVVYYDWEQIPASM